MLIEVASISASNMFTLHGWQKVTDIMFSVVALGLNINILGSGPPQLWQTISLGSEPIRLALDNIVYCADAAIG